MVLRIQPGQVEALRRVALAKYVDDLVAHGRETYPTIAAVAGDEGLRRVAEDATARARARGFEGKAGLRCWFETALLLGLEFDEDPAFAAFAHCYDKDVARARLLPPEDGSVPVGAVSGDGEPNDIDMMDDLHDACWGYLDAAVGEDFAELYRGLARARATLKLGDDGTAPIERIRTLDDMKALCERVQAPKVEALGPEAQHEMLTEAARRAAADGFEGHARAIYVLGVFVGGIGFLRDPGLGVDGRTIEERLPPISAGAEARGEGLARETSEVARRMIDAARAGAGAA